MRLYCFVCCCVCVHHFYSIKFICSSTRSECDCDGQRKTRENFIYTHINYNRYGIFLAIVQHTQTHTSTHTHTSRLKHYSPYRRFTISLPPSHLYSFGRSTKESESENLRAIGSHRSFYFHFHS